MTGRWSLIDRVPTSYSIQGIDLSIAIKSIHVAVEEVILVGDTLCTVTFASESRVFSDFPGMCLGRSKSAFRSPIMIINPRGRMSLIKELMSSNHPDLALGGLYTPSTITGLLTPCNCIFVIVHSNPLEVAIACRSHKTVGLRLV